MKPFLYAVVCSVVFWCGCSPTPSNGPTLSHSPAPVSQDKEFDVAALGLTDHNFGRWEKDGLVVNGVHYDQIGRYLVDKDGKCLYSLIVVFPVHKYQGKEYDSGYSLTFLSHKNSVLGAVDYSSGFDGSRYRLNCNQVCLMMAGKRIVKTNEELGIDLSDPKQAFSQEKLQPILEKTIRENVQP